MIDKQNHSEIRAKKSSLHYILIITISISIFSQILDFQSISRPLMFGFWGILLFNTTKRGRVFFRKESKNYAKMYLVYALYCFLCSIGNQQFLQNNYLSALIIPLVAMYTGESCAYDDGVKIESIIKAYIWAAALYALYVNIRYFNNFGSWLTYAEYIFGSKNSAAQIWCCAAILALFFYVLNEKKKERIIYFGIMLYLLFVCFVSGCRTAIAGFIIAVSIYMWHFKKHKLGFIMLLAAFLIIVWDNPSMQLYIKHFLQTDKNTIVNFNTITSGRGDNWGNGLKAFLQSPLIGNGKYYCDCSYISILAESGIIGFVLIESIWIQRIRINISRPNNTPIKVAIVVLTVFYIVESIFEGLPPFGPGVSAFMFWFLSGYYFSGRQYNEC